MGLLRLVPANQELVRGRHGGTGWQAVTNTLPGGDAVGASVQYRMLAGSGHRHGPGRGGLAVSSIIGVAGLFFLPIFALPVIIGGESVSAGLVHAGELG